MNTIRIFLPLLIGLTLASSCKKANLSDGDYLIFGHFYGECGGEGCIEIFKLESNRLLEDSKDNYPDFSDFYDGDFQALDKAIFRKVRNLIDFFPVELLKETDNIIGQPDAGDWGGLYIEYNYNGDREFWLLDQKKSNVPTYLHGFIDRVNEKIQLINN
ncbi:MAG: hypothetical protein IIA45_04735 [Bacteroidetes bacterium]|nr:hypothetical protein [Bacteroidota bacterium]